MTKRIAFQGEPGAYGHQACVEARPDYEPLPCPTFQSAIESVRKGDADLGMIAVENSTYGRVGDVHTLLPESGLHIVDEAFVRVRINLLGKKGAQLRNIEDHDRNTTRFLIMAREPDLKRRGNHGMVTSFVFRVRNIPAALYKAMGGFATNGVNMTKLESYMVDGHFTATQFYAEVEGHPDDRNVQLAMEELEYFTTNIRLMGVFPAAARRHETVD